MNEQQIKELAESMNVSVTDLMCLANSVVNSIVKDGAKEAFLSMDETDRVEMSSAYIPVAVRKMNQFTSTYLTNPEARKVFKQNVLEVL
jgi:hypothetical protein